MTWLLSAPFLTGFVWGLCEATWFFIVPDVLLCYWALKSTRAALLSTLAVVVGACAGAIALYALLAYVSPETLLSLWGHLPGYKSKMDLVAGEHVREAGARGLILGPSSGIPYRVYVLEAWRAGVALVEVLLWTPIARLERILIAPVVVRVLVWVSQCFLAPRWGGEAAWTRALTCLIAVYWICLYIWYWGFFLPGRY